MIPYSTAVHPARIKALVAIEFRDPPLRLCVIIILALGERETRIAVLTDRDLQRVEMHTVRILLVVPGKLYMHLFGRSRLITYNDHRSGASARSPL